MSSVAARGSKTQAIRDYMAANKDAMPKEIVAALKKTGVTVSPNLVSIIRSKMKTKKHKIGAVKAVPVEKQPFVMTSDELTAGVVFFRACAKDPKQAAQVIQVISRLDLETSLK